MVDYNGNTISYGTGDYPNEVDLPLYIYNSDSERDNALKGSYLISVIVAII